MPKNTSVYIPSRPPKSPVAPKESASHHLGHNLDRFAACLGRVLMYCLNRLQLFLWLNRSTALYLFLRWALRPHKHVAGGCYSLSGRPFGNAPDARLFIFRVAICWPGGRLFIDRAAVCAACAMWTLPKRRSHSFDCYSASLYTLFFAGSFVHMPFLQRKIV